MGELLIYEYKFYLYQNLDYNWIDVQRAKRAYIMTYYWCRLEMDNIYCRFTREECENAIIRIIVFFALINNFKMKKNSSFL
jgi:hypothetical protein